MTDQAENRISGKQVLVDAVTLFKDAGLYIYELSKTAIVKIKTLIADGNKDGEKPNDAPERPQ